MRRRTELEPFLALLMSPSGQQHHLEITVCTTAWLHQADLLDVDQIFSDVPDADIPEKRNLRQLIQQVLCRHQITGFESFDEPIVDGRQQLARLLGTALLMLQPCKACRCSLLP